MGHFHGLLSCILGKAVRTAGLAALASVAVASVADADYLVKQAIPLPNGQAITSFDIGFVDTTLSRYFLGDRSTKSVVAVDTNTNQVVGLFGAGLFAGNLPNSTGGPNGVITVNHTEVWAGDGDGTVKVLSAANGQLLKVIPPPQQTTGRADELCWDPQHNVVLQAWDKDGFVAFIDTNTHAVTKVIQMNGAAGQGPNATNGIEQCQWDARTNRIYLAIPEVNGPGNDSNPGAVVVLDGGTQSIVAVWPIPIAQCAGPQGLVIGPRREIALGCAKTGSVAIDDTTGAVVAAFPTEFGSDEIAYEAGGAHYVYTGANHAPPQLGFVRAADDTADQTNVAATGLHSVAADYIHRQVYFPVTNAAAPQAAKLCSPFGVSDALGCILVLQYQP